MRPALYIQNLPSGLTTADGSNTFILGASKYDNSWTSRVNLTSSAVSIQDDIGSNSKAEENFPVGKQIATAKVTDTQTVNGVSVKVNYGNEIKYTLKSGGDYFTIDENTGVIKAKVPLTAGKYDYTVTITGKDTIPATPTSSSIDVSGSITTTLAKPSITTQPTGKTVIENQTLTLSAVASFPNGVAGGTSTNNTYQWYKMSGSNAVAVSGATSATFTKTNMQAADAGEYFLRVSNRAGSTDSNHVTVGYTAKITSATLTSNVAGNSAVYGTLTTNSSIATAKADNGTGSGYVYSLNASGDYTLFNINSSTGAVTAKGLLPYRAAPYKIKVDVKDIDKTVTTAELSITVTKKAISVQPTRANYTYGGTASSLDFSVTSGTLVTGDKSLMGTMNVTYKDSSNNTISDITTAKPGTYKIVLTNFTTNGSNNKHENYTITPVEGSFTIAKAESTAPVLNAVSVVYGDSSYEYTKADGSKTTSSDLTLHAEKGNCGSAGTSTCSYTYAVKNASANDAITITNASTGAFTINKAGTVTLVVTKTADDYYNEKSMETQLTITPRAVTIKADDKSKYVGADLPSNSAAVTVGNLAYGQTLDNFTITYKYYNKDTFKTANPVIASIDKDTAVGTYDIGMTLIADGSKSAANYTWTFDKSSVGTLTIQQITDVDNFYSMDVIPASGWFKKDSLKQPADDVISITPTHASYTKMKVSLKSSDGSLTQLRDYATGKFDIVKSQYEGTNTFVVQFMDASNAITATKEITVKIDLTSPTVNGDETKWEKVSSLFNSLRKMIDSNFNAPAKLTVSANDNKAAAVITDTSGIATYAYQATPIDGEGNKLVTGILTKDASADNTFTISDNGRYQVDVTISDAAGNETVYTTYVSVDDKAVSAPEVSIKEDGETAEWDGSFTDKTLHVTLTASDSEATGSGSEEVFSEVEKYQVKIDDAASFSDLSSNTLDISDDGIHTYRFQVVYKNGTVSAIAEKTIKIDKIAPAFDVAVKDLSTNTAFVDGSISDDGLAFTLTPKDTYISNTTYYVYRKPEDGSAAEWKDITSEMVGNVWTTKTEFKGSYYFKAVNEAGVSTNDDVAGGTLVAAATGEVNRFNEKDIAFEAATADGAYSGDWTNKEITIKVSGGYHAVSNIAGYEFTTDDPADEAAVWITVEHMPETDTLKAIGNDTIVVKGTQESNKTYNFRAISNKDAQKRSAYKAIDVRYDTIAPIAEVVKSETQPTAMDVIVTVNVQDAAASSPIFRYSFDGGITWEDHTGGTIQKTFSQNVSSALKLEDETGNVTSIPFEINNIFKEKPKNPIVKNSEDYSENRWHTTDQIIEVEKPADAVILVSKDGNAYEEYDFVNKITVNDETQHRYDFKAVNGAKLESEVVSIYVNIDKKAPVNVKFMRTENDFQTLLNEITNGWLGKDNIDVKITADDATSGIDRVEYQITKKGQNAAEGNWKNGDSLSIGSDFTGTIWTRVYDKAGNVVSVSTSNGVIIDATGPVINTIPSMKEWKNITELSVDVSDAIAGNAGKLIYKVGTEAETEVDLTDGSYRVPLTDGEYDVVLKASDAAGNETVKTVHIMADSKMPSAVISSTLAVDKSFAEFSITLQSGESEVKEVYLSSTKGGKQKLDISALTPAVADGVYTYTLPGHKVYSNDTYTVELTTNAGVTISSAAVAVTDIVYEKPVLALSGNYVSDTWSAAPVDLNVVTINSATVERMEYRINDGKWNTYTGVITETHEGVNNYEFIANRGTDKESLPLKVVVKVDTSAPQAPLIQNADSYKNAWFHQAQNVEASIAATAGCKESLEYSLDGVNYYSGSSASIITEGIHKVFFRTRDELGRISKAVQSDVKIDLSAPSNFNISVENNEFKKFINSVTFGLFFNKEVDVKLGADYDISGKGQALYHISTSAMTLDELNALSDSAWISGDSFSINSEFKGFIYAKTSDAAGNTTAVISTDGVEVSFLSPELSVSTVGKESWVQKESLTLQTSADIESATYTVKNSSPVEKNITLTNGSAVISNLPDGEYDVVVTVTDRAGNTKTTTVAVKQDSEKPVLQVSGDSTGASDNMKMNIFASAGISGIDSVTVTSSKGENWDLSLTDGKAEFIATYNDTYTFTVKNKAGNTETKEVSVASITAQGPVIVLHATSSSIAYEQGTWSKDAIKVSLSDAFGKTGVTYSYVEKNSMDPTVEIADPSNVVLNTDGTHTYTFTAAYEVDGTSYTSTKDFTAKVDTQNPGAVTVADKTGLDTATWHQGSVTVTPTYSEPADRSPKWVVYSLDNGSSWVKLSSNGKLTMDTDGKHTVQFKAVDAFDRSGAVDTVYVNIDTQKPKDLNIKIADNNFKSFIHDVTFGIFFKDTQDVTISANDTLSGVDYYEYQYVDANSSYDVNNTWTRSDGTFSLPKGSKGRVHARAVDKSANISNVISSDGITIDNLNPELKMTHVMQEYANANSIQIEAKDQLAGLDKVSYTTSGLTPEISGEVSITDGIGYIHGLPDGSYDVKVTAIDKAGNSILNTTTVKVDTKTPTVKINDTNNGDTEKATLALSIENLGPSGIKEVVLNSTVMQSKILTPNADGSYSFDAYANGVYTVLVTTNSGAQAADTIEINNIITDKPYVKVSAAVNGKEYVEGTWAIDEVELTAVNVVDGLSNVKIEYTTEDGDDAVWKEYKSAVRVADERELTYRFRATANNVTGVITEFKVKSDVTGPEKTKLAAPAAYTKNQWYTGAQSVDFAFTPSTVGAAEWAEYRLDGAGQWVKLNDAQRTISIDSDGEHVLELRSQDEMGRVSETITAYVNIDSATKANGRVALSAAVNDGATEETKLVSLSPVTGISGIQSIKVSGNNITEKVLTPDANGNYSYVAEVSDTYTFTLTANNGEVAAVEKSIQVITTKPSAKVEVMEKDTSTKVSISDNDWVGTPIVIHVEDGNKDNTGSTIQVFKKSLETDEYPTTPENLVDGKYTIDQTIDAWYKIVVTNAAGDKESIEELHIKVDTTEVKNDTLTVEKEDELVIDNWFGMETKPEIELLNMVFTPTSGCKEWTEYSFDDGATWTEASKLDFTDRADGSYKVLARANDELNRGAAAAPKTLYINIDTTAPKYFNIVTEPKTSFFSTIFNKNEKVISFSGNFEISGLKEIQYKIVKDNEKFDPNTAADSDWETTTDPDFSYTLADKTTSKVYARGIDHAGNKTAVLVSDTQVVDESAPEITVSGTSVEVVGQEAKWGYTNRIELNAESYSGIASAVYTLTDKTTGTVTVDAASLKFQKKNGSWKAVLNDLPDGKYDFHLEVTSNAGLTQVVDKVLKIDIQEADLTLSDISTAEGVFIPEANLVLTPTAGISGIETLRVIQAPQGVNAPADIAANASGEYSYKITKNGQYKFELVKNNGSDPVTKTLNVTNISNVVPTLHVEAKQAGYDLESDHWSPIDIEFTLTNVNTDYSGDITYQYRIQNSDGTDGTWTNVPDVNGKNNVFTVKTDGIYNLTFRALSNSKQPSNEISFIAKIDSIPPNPVAISDQAKYGRDNWYQIPQEIKTTFAADTKGAAEKVQYRFVTENNGIYTAVSGINGQWTDGASKIVSDEGQQILQFRSVDETGRESAYQNAYVNIDKQNPTDMTITYKNNEFKSLMNAITFDFFFNDTLDVTLSASDNFDVAGTGLTYEYIKVEEADLAAFNPQADANVWRTGSRFSIDPEWKGAIYARAKDKSGRYSDIVSSDGITLDHVKPSLTLTPNGMDVWSTNNEIMVETSDALSGIDYVNWSNSLTGQDAVKEKSLQLVNGKATIKNLVDGNYTLFVKAYDKAGNLTEVPAQILIDTQTPTITVTGHDDMPKESEKLSILTTTGASGVKSLEVFRNGVKLDNVITTETIDGVLTNVYTVKENGVYDFVLTNNAGVSVKETIRINNVSNAKPELDINAKNGEKDYGENTWTQENVNIIVRNTVEELTDVKYYYMETKDGVVSTPAADAETVAINGVVWTRFNGEKEISENGIYSYEFIAESKSGVFSDTISYDVKIDKTIPPTPVINHASEFTADQWFSTAKSVSANYDAADTFGVEHYLEYNLDQEMNGAELKWNRVAAGSNVDIKTDGEHVISFRVCDKFKRASQTVSVPVNIDTQVPEFSYTLSAKGTQADITFKTKVGNSRIASFELLKEDNTKVSDIVDNVISVTETGTYKAVLINHAGVKVEKEIVVKTLNTIQPQIEVVMNQSATASGGNIYNSGEWTDESVTVSVRIANIEDIGTAKLYVQKNGNGYAEMVSLDKDSNLYEFKTGEEADAQIIDFYDFKAVSDSGISSEVTSCKVLIDKVAPEAAYNVVDTAIGQTASGGSIATGGNAGELLYKDGAWLNATQILKTDFISPSVGSEEFIEWQIDGGDWQRTPQYLLQTSKDHVVSVRTIDELGRTSDEKTFHVLIDKDRPSDLMVTIQENPIEAFINGISGGLFFKEPIEIKMRADFGVSAEGAKGIDGTIRYQIVDDVKDFDRNGTWEVYSGAIKKEKDFHGHVYYQAIDAAGNSSDIYHTDGITVDLVNPQMNVSGSAVVADPVNGAWSMDNQLNVTVKDPNPDDTAVAAGSQEINSGIAQVEYTLKTTPEVKGTLTINNKGEGALTLPNGSYEVELTALDKSGNSISQTVNVKVDAEDLTLQVNGHDDTVQMKEETLSFATTVGTSGYVMMHEADGTDDAAGTGMIKVITEIADASGVVQKTTTAIKDTDTMTITQNGTYTFVVRNHAGKEVKQVLNVNNIASKAPDVQVDMKTKDINGTTITYTENTWTSTSVDVYAKDLMYSTSTLQYYKNRLEGWQPFTESFTISDEGETEVKIRAISPSGQPSAEVVKIIKIDTKAPSKPVIENAKDYKENSWYAVGKQVKATADLNVESGCREWIEMYDESKKQWVEKDSVEILEEGKHTVAFRTNDELGRMSDEAVAYVNLDITPPVEVAVELKENAVMNALHAVTFGNFFKNTQEVYISADFNIAGPREVQYQIVKEGESLSDDAWTGVAVSDMNGSTFATSLNNGFKGTVYARAVDAVGNVSEIVNSDMVAVDADKPVISLPQDMDTWSNINKISMIITDENSDLDKTTIGYKLVQGDGTESNPVHLDLDETGKATISSLPNGEYDIVVSAKDNAGNDASATMHVMIDTQYPTANLLDTPTVPVNEKEMKVAVKYDGPSGIKSVIVRGDTITQTVLEKDEATKDDEFVMYPYMIKTNGNYEFVITTNAGNSITKKLKVDKIQNDTPVLKVVGKDNKDKTEIVSDVWSMNNVELTVENTSTNKTGTTYYYQILNMDNTEFQAVTPIRENGNEFKIVAKEEGAYKYVFTAKNAGGVEGEPVIFIVKIDRTEPETPIIIDRDKEYAKDIWHNTPQSVGVAFAGDVATDGNIASGQNIATGGNLSVLGADEKLQYNLDDEKDAKQQLVWRDVDEITKKIAVSTEKAHVLKVRVIDELDRTSSINTAYVNIDKSAPKNFTINIEENSFKKAMNDATFGIFFNKTMDVTVTGDFDISGEGQIWYQVVKDGETYVDDDAHWKNYSAFSVDEKDGVTIYAKAYDKAGNEVGPIKTDLLQIETVPPVIAFPDYDGITNKGWTNDNSLKVKITDAQSGVGGVSYYAMEPNADVKGDLSLNTDGETWIQNLPDGNIILNVVAKDNAKNEVTRKISLAIDTATPTFDVTEQVNGSDSVTLTIPHDTLFPGISGVDEKKVFVTSANGTVTKLKKNADGDYIFVATANDTYTFTVTNNAGTEGQVPVIVSSIGESDPAITVIGAEDRKWTAENNGNALKVEVIATPHSDELRTTLKKLNGTAITPEVPEEAGDYQTILNLTETGRYEYEFVSHDANGDKITLPFDIYFDNDTPNAPVLSDLYDEDHYYHSGVNVSAEHVKTSLHGSDEWVQYNVNGETENGMLKWIDGSSVNIADTGKNIVRFRSVDEVGHISEVTTAVVHVTASNLTISMNGTTQEVESFLSKIVLTNVDAPITSLVVYKDPADPEKPNNSEVYRVITPKNGITTYPVVISANGHYYAVAVDAAGNIAKTDVEVTNIIAKAGSLNVEVTDGAAVHVMDEWSENPLTITAADVNSNPNAEIYYVKVSDNTSSIVGTETKYSAPIVESTTGIREYRFYLKDKNTGTEIPGSSQQVMTKVDVDDPIAPSIKDIAQYTNADWYSTGQILTGLPTNSGDHGSQEHLEYSITKDGAAQSEWRVGEQAPVSREGNYKVKFRAVDELGRATESIDEAVVQIDMQAPRDITITSDDNVFRDFLSKLPFIGKYFAQTGNISISAVDNNGAAAIDRIEYKIVPDGSVAANVSWTTYTAPFALPDAPAKDFAGKIYVRAYDKAGNESSEIRTDQFIIDQTTPVIELNSNVDITSFIPINEVGVEISENKSGVDVTSLKWKAEFSDPTNDTNGTYTIDKNGIGTIIGLPDGEYRLTAEMKNNAGTSAATSINVKINAQPWIMAIGNVPAAPADKADLTIDVSDVKEIKPDTLYVKKGVLGSYEDITTVSGFADAGAGTVFHADYSVTQNEVYTFKAENKATGKYITQSVDINMLEAAANTIDLSKYIFFMNSDTCKDDSCYFESYKKPTSNTVTLGIKDMETLKHELAAANATLTISVDGGKTYTWNTISNILTSVNPNNPDPDGIGTKIGRNTIKISVVSGGTVQSSIDKLFVLASNDAGQTPILLNQSGRSALFSYLSAEPIQVVSEYPWQIVKAGEQPQEDHWTLTNEEVEFVSGSYTMYTKNEDGTVTEKSLTVSSSKDVEVEKTEIKWKSFIKTISFGWLCSDNVEIKLNMSNDYLESHDIAYSLNDTDWMKYEGSISISGDYEGTIQIKSTDKTTKEVVEDQISLTE